MFSDSSSYDMAGGAEAMHSQSQLEVQERIGATVADNGSVGTTSATSKNGDPVLRQDPPLDLLNVIWQAIQEDGSERKKEREKDDKIRRKDREDYDKIRLESERRSEERLDKMQQDIIKTAEQSTKQFRAETDRLNEQVLGKLNNETDKLAKYVASVWNDTQQQIQSANEKLQSMNDKFDCVNESVQERLREHISETKRNRTN
jgi:hypothetical protein